MIQQGDLQFLESIELKYAELARERGVYVVGACGWDSIPCDLGTDFLNRNFDGTLGYVESFVSKNLGPSGYSFSTTSYDTLILCISNDDKLGAMRRAIMPERLPDTKHYPPRRRLIWKINERDLQVWVLPFPGADKSIVQRSQYYDNRVNGKRPFQIATYFSFDPSPPRCSWPVGHRCSHSSVVSTGRVGCLRHTPSSAPSTCSITLVRQNNRCRMPHSTTFSSDGDGRREGPRRTLRPRGPWRSVVVRIPDTSPLRDAWHRQPLLCCRTAIGDIY
ncbi:hypothetical protein PENTCL1PPCAC_14860 [Pristionchus entomophagus]|uniref:Uncharacterized protein n=1 Tax=Pristionchus entomophagus TaxID=358040 RepID=A0AAV5TGA0_9BILA|nr:hypothetical protein PENTCL1PPCAC_14860 [Pristionchus entomophagus]